MALTRFTIRQLEAFLAIVELHSIAKAADRLALSASAVSQLLGELERELGFRLFDRTTRRVELSSAGRDFLGAAQSVLRYAHAASQAADDIRNKAAGIVRVGAPLVIASTALPAAITEYERQRPKVVVRVIDTGNEQLVDRVSSGDVDIAVGPDQPAGQQVTRETSFVSPWVLWCAPSHPVNALDDIRWKDLRQVSIVATGRDHERGVAQMLVDLPADARIIPVEVVDNITTAFGLVAQGRAVTLAPAYVKPLAQTYGLVMRHVIEPETIREVCVYRPSLRALSPSAEGFAEFLVQWLQQWDESMKIR